MTSLHTLVVYRLFKEFDMKVTLIKLILAFSPLFFSMNVFAIDGNELMSKCLDAQQVADNQRDLTYPTAISTGFCLGFSQGVQNTLQFFPKEAGVCFPKEGITAGQSMRIILKYLQDNPSQLHQKDTVLAVIAFKKAYPCR